MKTRYKKITILAITIGSILEYYDLGLIIYWAPIIGKILADISLPVAETINSITAICIGLAARPLGAYLFGKSGDRHGRKKAFTRTVILIAIPTVLIGIPFFSFEEWSLYATIYIALMKFLQGIPAGGELPGAICYLTEGDADEIEGADEKEKIFTGSFSLVGPQVGLLFSLGVVLFLQKYLAYEVLIKQGWRGAFLTTGLLSLGGYLLRKKLHETHEFDLIEKGHQVVESPVKELFKHHKREVILACGLSIFEIVSFCLLTIVPVFYFRNLFNFTQNGNLIINVISLMACTIFPPILGKITSIYPHRKIQFMNISAWGFIALSPFFYYAVSHTNLIFTLSIQAILVILFGVQVAILPSLLASLFPTPIRYTGIGFSFNICDGILWGLIPILSTLLINKTQNTASFVIFFPIAAAIFLISSRFLKQNKQKIEEKNKTVIYRSDKEKSDSQANHYSKTHDSTHRYLAYRDIPSVLEKFFRDGVVDKIALDYGTGTGYSANFLRELGFKVIGVDVSKEMLFQARIKYPDLTFHQTENAIIPIESSTYDLVFSSFVLFEMGTREEIITYLSEAKRIMKKDGLFVAITGSQDLYSSCRKWVNFRVDFPENKNLFSGKLVKLFLNGLNMEFKDFYWTEADYYNFFSEVGLDIVELHRPLGNRSDPYLWKDEMLYSPYLILVVKVITSSQSEELGKIGAASKAATE
jgi:MFS family permease